MKFVAHIGCFASIGSLANSGRQEVNVQWMVHACQELPLCLKSSWTLMANLATTKTTGAGKAGRKLESVPSLNSPVIKNEA